MGSHAISAHYLGDGTFAFSLDTLTQSVNQAATSTTISASANPWAVGMPVTFTAAVSVVSPGGGVPNGSVVFTSGSTMLATVPLAVVNGVDQAAFTTAALRVGTDPITASYVNSDGNDLASSATLNQVILGPGAYAFGTQLFIVGANSVDSAQVSAVGSKSDGTTGLKVNSTLNSVSSSKTFNQAFTAVFIFGFGGNDNFQLASTLTLTTNVTEGNGNNYIQLGGGNDVITLGTGCNQVFGGGGNKTITVQDAAGTTGYIQLGAGNHTISLGAGNDQVVLGDGNNTVTAGSGNDAVTAGEWQQRDHPRQRQRLRPRRDRRRHDHVGQGHRQRPAR